MARVPSGLSPFTSGLEGSFAHHFMIVTQCENLEECGATQKNNRPNVTITH